MELVERIRETFIC